MSPQIQSSQQKIFEQTLLTIAIPTFNRNESLNRTLERLLPQLTPEIRLVVIDNASDVPIAETSREILNSASPDRVTLLRNRANLGGNANILRCVEASLSEFVWILGDDDYILPNAVQTILNSLKLYQDAWFLEFSTSKTLRTVTVESTGVDEFVKNIQDFGCTLFISTTVYRVDVFLKKLNVGYHYAYAMAPHIAVLMSALQMDGKAYFLPERIVEINVPQGEQQWPTLRWGLGVMTLLELDMLPNTRRTLAKKILQGSAPMEWLVWQLLLNSADGRKNDWSIFVFRQLVSRVWCYNKKPWHIARVYLYSLMLHFPGASLWLISFVRRLLGKGRQGKEVQDMYARL
jgi:glycosyltransferase involved in cell wall biosynthesis